MMRVNRLIAVVFIVVTARLAAAQAGGANTGWSRPIAPYASEASGSVLDADGATVMLRAAQAPTDTNAFGSIAMRVPAEAHRLHRVTLTGDLSSLTRPAAHRCGSASTP
jgi:hypothetical protein